MKKIGIFGGTFNPIHRGHVWLAEEFSRRLSLDHLLLIPTKQPTHKQAVELAAAEHRLAMCRLAAQPLGFSVSDTEITRETDSYTVLTLRELKQEFPDDDFYLLMGEDMFLTLEQWREPEAIFSMAALCVSPRSSDPDSLRRLTEYARRLEGLGGRCFLLDIPYLPVSSTKVRQTIRHGGDLREWVPDVVADYIAAHHLYETEPSDTGSGMVLDGG